MHGIALNVTTDLRYFDLIVPCGLIDRQVTSIQQILGPAAPSMETVRQALIRRFFLAFPASANSPLATANLAPGE